MEKCTKKQIKAGENCKKVAKTVVICYSIDELKVKMQSILLGGD